MPAGRSAGGGLWLSNPSILRRWCSIQARTCSKVDCKVTGWSWRRLVGFTGLGGVKLHCRLTAGCRRGVAGSVAPSLAHSSSPGGSLHAPASERALLLRRRCCMTRRHSIRPRTPPGRASGELVLDRCCSRRRGHGWEAVACCSGPRPAQVEGADNLVPLARRLGRPRGTRSSRSLGSSGHRLLGEWGPGWESSRGQTLGPGRGSAFSSSSSSSSLAPQVNHERQRGGQ